MWRASAATVLLVATAVQADDEYSEVRDAVKSLAPKASIERVGSSPIPGLAEVVVGGHVVYVSEDGKYLVQGSIMDIASRKDLTEVTQSKVRKDKIGDMLENNPITFAPEEPEHWITVFTDIDCAYCRRLHRQREAYMENGIGIRYLFFPRAGLNSKSFSKAVSVWCADDRRSALTQAKAGDEPQSRQCPNPVKEHYELGQQVGVRGTPAIIAEDGTMISGYVPPEKLLTRLERLAGEES